MKSLFAAALSVALNGGIVVALANASGSATDREAPPRPVTLSTIEPPPPPPPPVERDTAAPSTAIPLPTAGKPPPLELPPMASGSEGIALEMASGAQFDWGMGFELPKYSAEALAAESEGDLGREPPVAVFQPDLERHYPRNAMQARVEGRTVVQMKIDARGRVTQVIVLKSEPKGVFERAAASAAREIRFQPAKKNGRPIVSRVKLEFVWTLDK
ncbi:MAG: energy transducer TonB [Deltaproteobacteria bacterium]|jgi:protein TonB